MRPIEKLFVLVFVLAGSGLLFSAYGFFSSLIEEYSLSSGMSESTIYLFLLATSIIAGLFVNEKYNINIKRK